MSKAAPPSSSRSRQHGIKNKSAAPVQITAEQILREAQEFKETEVHAPTHTIGDAAELADYRLRKRKEFEDIVRRQRHSIGTWIKYAKWEASQNEVERARSVFERAIDVDHRNPGVWTKYAEMEMKLKFVNHARNIYDRAVTLLPRIDQFWYKWLFMEEMVGNSAGARVIFERWLKFHPDAKAWNAYIKMELRYGNKEHARSIFERYTIDHNNVDTYLKYAKFELKQGEPALCRKVFEKALIELGEDGNDEKLLLEFAKFEESQHEYDRARTVYKYALDNVPKSRAEELYQLYAKFEKQHGSIDNVEQVIVAKRRFTYEDEIKANPYNYDAWFDYIRLEESNGEMARIRDIFERAIANVPPIATEKKYWKRYIYLWVMYAQYEELVAKDIERTRNVYSKCLALIPHKSFTFTKIWVGAANFEIRCKNLPGARKIFGNAIGLCPTEKLFTAYIQMETSLAQRDRARTLYEKFINAIPSSSSAWCSFATFEAALMENERARALFELGISQPLLDQPEVVWKKYIDFEISINEISKARVLYQRLVGKSKHPKIFISAALFELQTIPPGVNRNSQEYEAALNRARKIFESAEKFFKDSLNSIGEAAAANGNIEAIQHKENRLMILMAYKEMESKSGSESNAAALSKKFPQKIKKRRPITGANGEVEAWEEYVDLLYPDDAEIAGKAGTLKMLQMAKMWKLKQLQAKKAEEDKLKEAAQQMDQDD